MLLFELGLDVRSEATGGCGERADGREACDMSEVERDDEVGNDDNEVRRFPAIIFEPLVLPKFARMFSLAGARVYDGREARTDAIDRQVWRCLARVEGGQDRCCNVYFLDRSGR